MSQPHHALLFIMTALPWQCLLQTSLLAAVAAAESCLKVRGDGPRIYQSTIRFYDHYGHVTRDSSVQRFPTKTLYTRARATDGSTMLAPMSPGAGKGLRHF